jgi:hypothetical protein
MKVCSIPDCELPTHAEGEDQARARRAEHGRSDEE